MGVKSISGTVTHTVSLGRQGYSPDVTILSTGFIAPSSGTLDGVDVSPGIHAARLVNHGRIFGENSVSNSQSGGFGVDAAAPLALTNTGTIAGGGAASEQASYTFGGGIGVDLHDGGSIVNSGVISGGSGGYDTFSPAGNGVDLSGGILSNSGSIIGGGGGDVGNYGTGEGSGAVGLILTAHGEGANAGLIRGGQGGSNVSDEGRGGGASGGVGLMLDASTLSNTGTIAGGFGGYGYGASGSGGAGVAVYNFGTLTNAGVIAGSTGAGSHFRGGDGGDGVLINEATLINTGRISGGAVGQGEDGGYAAAGIGVMLNGGTLVTSGKIIGGNTFYSGRADAVAFGTLSSTLVIDPTATFVGKVEADAKADDTLVLAGSSAATLAGLGQQITGFTDLSVAVGATWTFTGAPTLRSATSFLDSGVLTIAQSLTDHGDIKIASGGVLNVENAGTLTINHLAIAGGATLSAYGRVAANVLTDNGTIVAAGGTLTLVAEVSGSGTIEIADGATLHMVQPNPELNGGVTGVSVLFEGSGKLHIGAPIASTISGFGTGDVIQINRIATSFTFTDGKLALYDGQTYEGHLLLAGDYTSASFSLTADGHGGTDISFAAADGTHILYQSALARTGEHEAAYVGGHTSLEVADPLGFLHGAVHPV